MAVVLQVVAHGLCFAAGGADLAGDDADHIGGHAQLLEYREGVVDASWDVESVFVDQFVVVQPEFGHDHLRGKALTVEIGHLQLALWCGTQQQYDGAGFAQLMFQHQVTAHLRHEQEADEQEGGENACSYEVFFTGQLSEL